MVGGFLFAFQMCGRPFFWCVGSYAQFNPCRREYRRRLKRYVHDNGVFLLSPHEYTCNFYTALIVWPFLRVNENDLRFNVPKSKSFPAGIALSRKCKSWKQKALSRLAFYRGNELPVFPANMGTVALRHINKPRNGKSLG